MAENTENVIEWITNQHTITCTFTQEKWKNKAKKLAKEHPDKVRIICENSDGSMLVKMPIKALKLSIIERELTEEQRKEKAERMRKALSKK